MVYASCWEGRVPFACRIGFISIRFICCLTDRRGSTVAAPRAWIVGISSSKFNRVVRCLVSIGCWCWW